MEPPKPTKAELDRILYDLEGMIMGLKAADKVVDKIVREVLLANQQEEGQSCQNAGE